MSTRDGSRAGVLPGITYTACYMHQVTRKYIVLLFFLLGDYSPFLQLRTDDPHHVPHGSA